MFELSSRWVIDGSKRYNVARYMNHSLPAEMRNRS